MLLFLVLGVFILFVFFELNSKVLKSSVLYALSITLAFIEGLRWFSGTDFFMYYNSYESLLLANTEMHNQRYDILYYWLSYFFKFLGIDYTFFLLFLSFFSGVLYAYSLKKITNYPITAMFFLFVNTIGFWGSNRQLIALSIIFFGVQFLVNGKKWMYVLLVIIASGFHFTAVIMILLLAFTQKINFRSWSIMVGVALIISTTPLIPFLLNKILQLNLLTPFLQSRFTGYLKLNESFQVNYLFAFLGTFKKLIPILIMWCFRNKINDFSLKYYNLFLNIAFFSLILYIICAQHFEFFLGRLTIYFSIFECVVYVWGFSFINNSKYKYHISFIFFVFCIIVFFKSISPYPELFIPYKTRFFTL